jgi:uncharacterized delta-60 repeat protein
MNMRTHSHRLIITTLLLTLAACGGGGDEDPAPQPPAPPPPAGTIGAAGGTVTGPNGAKVEIPAGALATNVEIRIEQTSVGAPALPGNVTGAGQIFALTPHGTTFATPVTITLPFDPATVPAGARVKIFKTDAALTQWAEVVGATISGNTLTAQVTGFSDVIAGVEREAPQRECLLHVDRTGEVIRADDFDRAGWEEFRCEQQFPSNPFSLDGDQFTMLETFSSRDGVTFMASAEDLGAAQLTQAQGFIKRAANATLQFVITEAVLEAADRNQVPTPNECPRGVAELATCAPMHAEILFMSSARGADWDLLRDRDGKPVFNAAGYATLKGRVGLWDFDPGFLHGENLINVWSGQNFVYTDDLDGGDQKRHPRAKLLGSIVLDVDLSSIPVADPELEAHEVVDGKFFIVSVLQANAVNGRSRESAVRAAIKDPAGVGGTAINFTGLELTTERLPLPQPPDETPPTPCTRDPNPDPAAGVLQFSAPTYSILETHSAGAGDILVTRTQGSTGAVSVTFTASGGTAVPGTHYTPLTTTVYFGDGDTNPRTVPLEIVRNDINEPDTTVTLTLSGPGGCAAVGSQSSAVLTILDDDRPPPDTGFTIGGTVSGLSGTGLVLQNLGSNDLSPANGTFTFSIPFPDGIPYNVTVATQPTNPNQVCSVTNGSGIVSGANVTNVQVICTTPPPPGGLDPGFGGGSGIVTSAFGGDETDMLLLGDGKILMVGGSGTDFIMARYDTDGSLDESFGDGGLVTTDIAGGPDAAFGAALQGDSIIVVGSARVAGNDDFAIVRYDRNGVLDTSFGTQGRTTTDFFGARDRAFAVEVQPDNGIIVVGDAISGGRSDFAIARYDANGAIDATFGGSGNGKVATDIAGGVDIAKNVVLEDGGTILVTGTITLGNSSVLANAGLARYTATGALDPGFGVDGILSIAQMSLGEGLALQPDGKILLAGHVPVAGRANFAVMRLSGGGIPDPSFGSGGLTTVGFTSQDDYGRDVTLDAAGRVLVSGQASNLSNPDFAVARFDSAGVLDGGFDTDGRFRVDFFGASDSAENLAVQADGKIVLGGFAVNGTSTRYGLARINP